VANMIKRDAQQLAQKVLAGLVPPEALLPGNDKNLEFAEPYHRWVLRTMCEDPAAALAEKLGPDLLAECRRSEIGYNCLVVASRANPGQGKTLVTMPMAVFRPRFSPDGRHVAYVTPLPRDENKGVLLVASTDGKVDAMEVAVGTAFGYDWRPDSRALAYVKQDGDAILGTLEEKVVVDEQGALMMEVVEADEEGCLASSRSTGRAKQLVGTMFQPLMHVQYGLDGRMLFSSAAVAIPTTELEEPTYSVFCYDRVTGTVTDVLPGVIRNRASQNICFFRLSPDGKRLIVPLQYNRFAIYELGSNEAVFPCEGDEGFGMDELPDFVPSWKGNDKIVCMVSEKGHFLAGDDGQPRHRKEVVVLGTDGQLREILSSRWPDEAIPQSMQDKASEGFKTTP
jgi:WD40-like Beta Propeller Repeat